RGVGLPQVVHELAVFVPDAAVRLLVFVEHGARDAGQYAAALVEEEIGERETLAGEPLVHSAHHVGQGVARVAAQQVALHRLVGARRLPRAHAAREIVAAEVQYRAGGVADLAGDRRRHAHVADAQRRAAVRLARLVDALHAIGVDVGVVGPLLHEPRDRVVGDHAAQIHDGRADEAL